MSRPDLFPPGEPAFDLAENRQDFRRVVLVLVLTAVVIGTGAAL